MPSLEESSRAYLGEEGQMGHHQWPYLHFKSTATTHSYNASLTRSHLLIMIVQLSYNIKKGNFNPSKQLYPTAVLLTQNEILFALNAAFFSGSAPLCQSVQCNKVRLKFTVRVRQNTSNMRHQSW